MLSSLRTLLPRTQQVAFGSCRYDSIRCLSRTCRRSQAEPVDSLTPTDRIRNIAIIAHVDHGKTTLVDQLLRQSGTIKRLSATEKLLYTPASASATGPGSTTADSQIDDGFVNRLMDSNDLERERGITILSKCTSVVYNDNLINIVDTPGHADFGGEVERIMSMVDGVALIVDATEGPMTQTRFVLSKALRRGLRPLVVLNKADRTTCRPEQVESDLFDLFATLGATDDQADYPLLYASAKQGWAQDTLPQHAPPLPNMTPLFDLIMTHVPPPIHLERASPFSMLTIQIEADPYVGMLYLGRIHSGVLKIGDTLWGLNASGERVGEGKVKKIFGRRGLQRIEKDTAGAGEIVSIAGIKCQSNSGGGVNVTLIHPEGWGESGPKALPTTPIDPPTISIHVFTNDSPLAGKEGTKLTSQMIRDRIYKEAETNIALHVLPGPTSESLELRGRGVLHLGVLLETLRREGFELGVGPPKAVMIPDPDLNPEGHRKGTWLEPIEECTVVVREEYAGEVVQKLTLRKGEMKSYESGDPEEGWVKVVMDVPARGLIGYMAGEFGNDVHGQGTINHIFKGYEPYKGAIDTGRNGALISMALGESSGYSMAPLQARGTLFVHPQTQVYPGMVIGESSKTTDLYLNPCIKKQLTNIRAAGADDKIVLSSPKVMGLEEALAYMGDDEIVEVTPGSVRLRKKDLEAAKRGKTAKAKN